MTFFHSAPGTALDFTSLFPTGAMTLMLPPSSPGAVPPCDHLWPPHLDEMAPPLHIFDLRGATYIMKYWHVGVSRPDEWLVLYPEHKASFIRRTKQLGIDLSKNMSQVQVQVVSL